MAVMLLKYGADINAQSGSGLTALSHAAAKGHLNIVKLLIDNKAQVRVHDLCCQASVYNC